VELAILLQEIGWIGMFLGGFAGKLRETGFKNHSFFHFLRRFSTFLREIEKNNGF